MLSRLALKRVRSVSDADTQGDETKRRRCNDKHRGERRKHIVAQVLGLDDFTFKKMFRMDKQSMLLLHSKISVILDKGISARNVAMARVSSRSQVNSLLHLCCTLRWLAGA